MSENESGNKKRVEEALKESELNLKKAQELAKIGHWELCPATMEIKGSDELFRIFNLPKEKADLESFAGVVHPEDREYDLGKIDRGIKYGEPWDIEHRLKLKDGTMKWVRAIGEATKDKKGKVIKVIGTVQDITEKKKAEEELQKLASVVTHTSELVNLADLEGNMIFINKAGAKILGISPKEVTKHKIMEVIPEHLQEIVTKELLPELIIGGVWEGDMEYLNIKTKKITPVHAITFTVKDPKTKKPLYLANVSSDITKQKKAEEELKKLNLELDKRVKERTKALQSSERRLDFVSMMSHQLRTPVSAAQATLDMLKDEDETGSLKMASERINNLNDIIGTLIFYIENEDHAGKLTEEKGGGEVKLITSIKEQISLLEKEIADKKIVVNQELPSEIIVWGDQVVINRILYSVFENAVTYNKEHGNINISVTKDDHSVIVEVEDTGYGIPEAEQDQVFTKFFRASNASQGVNEGSGLSLYLTFVMMKILGGKIEFKSVEDSGSTFYLHFPVHSKK